MRVCQGGRFQVQSLQKYVFVVTLTVTTFVTLVKKLSTNWTNLF